MNYIDYINSKDVRAYLKSIDFKPNLLEAAYFIYSSSNKTLDERHHAWEELIEETDDLILNEGAGSRWEKTDRYVPATYGMSSHELIRKHMKDEKLILAYFYSDNDNCVFVPEFTFYSKCYVGESRPEYHKCEAGVYFGRYEDAQRYCLREVSGVSDIIDYSITKHLFSNASDNYSNYVKVKYNLSGEIMSVSLSGSDHERFPQEISDYLDSEDKLSIYYDFFGNMWFDIPIPFKKGDIVIPCTSCHRDWTPFVMLETDPEWRKRKANEGKPYREGTDSSDMIATGWSIGFGENPTEIFDYEMVNYLDIEYYREDFKGIERLLPLLALQVKGDIDLWEWEIIKNEIIRTSLPNPKLEYMMSFQNVSKILEGSSVYIE